MWDRYARGVETHIGLLMSHDLRFNIIIKRELNLSELENIDAVLISASITDSKENIASRKTIVYQTLIDPAVARIEGEKNKHKLFNKFLFKLNTPAEIEFVSTEKYYEPYITISGKYSIDYYRKCSYAVTVDKKVTEVILFDHTFMPKKNSNSTLSESSIKVEGEERLIKEEGAFLFLNRNGQESKLSEFPPAPSEENPQELIKSFKMPEIAPNLDLDIIRKKILKRPNDINRIVTEMFEIDARSVIYRPIFKVTYKCSRIGEEAHLEFDGVTSKMIGQNPNIFYRAIRFTVKKIKRLSIRAINLFKPVNTSQS